MDKYYGILETYGNCLEDLLDDFDISPVDVLVALDQAGYIDCDELYIRMSYEKEEESDS